MRPIPLINSRPRFFGLFAYARFHSCRSDVNPSARDERRAAPIKSDTRAVENVLADLREDWPRQIRIDAADQNGREDASRHHRIGQSCGMNAYRRVLLITGNIRVGLLS